MDSSRDIQKRITQNCDLHLENQSWYDDILSGNHKSSKIEGVQ